MRRKTSVALLLLLSAQICLAQLPAASAPSPQKIVANIPAGTQVDIATANSINSAEVKVGDVIVFRVLKDVKIDGVTLIAENALATGRVSKATRGRSFGRAGELAWEMREVVAVNGQSIPLSFAQQQRKGASKGGTVAAATVVTGVMLFYAAPVALLWGFKRGKSAVFPAGTVLTAVTSGDAALALDAPR